MDKKINTFKNSLNTPRSLINNNNNLNSENTNLKTMKVSDLFKNMYSKDAGRAINSLKENYISKSILKKESEKNSNNGLPSLKPIQRKHKSISTTKNFYLNPENDTFYNEAKKIETFSKIQNQIINQK